MECPAPGIYRGVPFRDYRAWPAVNSSRLKLLGKSPAHYRAYINTDSDAMRFGRLLHGYVLEPDTAPAQFQLMPDFAKHPDNCTSGGKPSKSATTAWCQERRKTHREECEQAGVTLITQAELNLACECVTAIKQFPQFRRYIPEDSGREVSIVWEDRHTGILCKARYDCVFDELTDLKTDRDANPDNFEWVIAQREYHCQAAWYQDGLKTLTGERLPFNFLVCGKEAPIQVVGKQLGNASIEAGRDINLDRMALLEQCMRDDDWPGYSSEGIFEIPDKYLPDEVTV